MYATLTTISLSLSLSLFLCSAPVSSKRKVNPLTPTVAIWVQYSYKASCAVPDRVKRSFVIFDIRAL